MGKAASRSVPVTAKARTRPPCTGAMAVGAAVIKRSICPAIKSANAAPAPRYGMCASFTFASLWNTSAARWVELACPPEP
ncbi:hypothetical protein D3C71_1683250 [compost metagenome]